MLLDEQRELSASSPDEQAFVAAAELLGYEFAERHDDEGYVLLKDKRTGAVETVQVLTAFPYECRNRAADCR